MAKKQKLSQIEKRKDTLAAITKIDKEKLLEQLNKYPIVQVACERAGVGRSTYYEWRKNDPKFAKRADEALGRGIGFVNDLAESMLIKKMQESHMTAIIFWLKNHHSGYNDRIIHEHHIEEREFTKEEKDRLKDALSKIGLNLVIEKDKLREQDGTEEKPQTGKTEIESKKEPKAEKKKELSHKSRKGVNLKDFLAHLENEKKRELLGGS